MDPIHGGEGEPLTEGAQLLQVCDRVKTLVTGKEVTSSHQNLPNSTIPKPISSYMLAMLQQTYFLHASIIIMTFTQRIILEQNFQRLLLLHPSEAYFLIICRTKISLRVVSHSSIWSVTQTKTFPTNNGVKLYGVLSICATPLA